MTSCELVQDITYVLQELELPINIEVRPEYRPPLVYWRSMMIFVDEAHIAVWGYSFSDLPQAISFVLKVK